MSYGNDECRNRLTVWFPNVTSVPVPLTESATKVNDTHIRYRCVREDGHDGDHGWRQGLDTDWTFRWDR